MIKQEFHRRSESHEPAKTRGPNEGPELSKEQARVELIESLLDGKDECHVAIRNRPGLLGVNRLLNGKNHSWVHIERQVCGNFDLMWTSDRDTHQRLAGPAYSVGVSPSGQVISMYKSALSMWMDYHHQFKPDSDRRERAETIANRLFGFMRMRGEPEV
jgi:hypothetical protein